MNVLLTFDVEIWCNGWENLDAEFPGCFERYVYGTSKHGQFALPKTLEILARHDIPAVFFVEPLFAGRFGLNYLQEIVALINRAGQEIQLHLHPEWTNEIHPPIIKDNQQKRQHLCYYTLEEQQSLIAYGKRMLEAAGAPPVSAFRTGSYAFNRDTIIALGRNNIRYDSSLNIGYDISGNDLRNEDALTRVLTESDVIEAPISVFMDGLGKLRPTQVGACSVGEFKDSLDTYAKQKLSDYVIVSHNFEMLKSRRIDPDWIVVKRFDALCRHLASNRSEYRLVNFNTRTDSPMVDVSGNLASVSTYSTLKRIAEQALRRVT
jgi:peptidoglycan/xylan/chitin deacetylase (PgdA/CDA1 family)